MLLRLAVNSDMVENGTVMGIKNEPNGQACGSRPDGLAFHRLSRQEDRAHGQASVRGWHEHPGSRVATAGGSGMQVEEGGAGVGDRDRDLAFPGRERLGVGGGGPVAVGGDGDP